MELTIEQVLQQGITAHREGKLQDAERLYRAILQSQPLHPDANHNLGVLAVSVNKAGTALPLFKTALEVNPKMEQFWLSYIDALIKDKQFDNAKQLIEQAKKQGLTEEKLNTLDAQLSSKTQIQNVNSANPPQEQLSSLLEYYQTGRYADAERLAMSITQEFSTHQFGWKVLGAVLKQTGRLIDSLTAMQKSVQLAPQDAEAHSNLGVTLKELGKLVEAAASYRQAIVLKPDYAEAHYNLGITHQELGKLVEAEVSFRQAIVFKPDYAEAHSNLGVTLQELGKLVEAEASYRQAIVLKPDYAEAHYNLGITLQELGKLVEAEASYRQAIVLKPDYAEAHSNLGVTLQELGKLVEAEASFRQAIVLKPDYAEAHSNLGVTLQELGKLVEAEASFRQAIVLKPDYLDGARNLVVLPVGQLDSGTLNLCEKTFSVLDDSLEDKIKYFFFQGNLLKHRGFIEQSFNTFCKANSLKLEVIKGAIIEDANKNIDSLMRIKKWMPSVPDSSGEPLAKLFIMGPSKSGKSLVEHILSESSQVKTLYEAIRYDGLIKNNGCKQDSSQSLFENIFFESEANLLAQGYKVVTSTHPISIFYSDYLMDMLPNAYFIIVKRDLQDVSPEIFTSEYQNGNLYSYHPNDISKYLGVYNRICETLALKVPDRCLTVCFEDIIKVPEDVVDRINRLVGSSLRVNHLKKNVARFQSESLFRGHYAALNNESKY
jgi:tetratricopeptide (TPR) repeat protein